MGRGKQRVGKPGPRATSKPPAAAKLGTVVPAFLDDGHWSACFGLSYLELTLHDLAGSRRIMNEKATYLRKVAGTGGIPDGRNEVVASFLDGTEADWLWFVDTDMGFGRDTVDRLVEAADPVERPVVGALCFANRRVTPGEHHAEKFGMVPTVYNYADLGAEIGFLPIEDYATDQLIKVSATGAACILIHRGALEKIREKFGDVWFNTTIHPTGLRGQPRSFSEDLSFCVRLAALDVPLHVHTGVRTCHEKGGIFLDEDAYRRQQTLAAHELSQKA